jgi:CheY-like chemotaxis protein
MTASKSKATARSRVMVVDDDPVLASVLAEFVGILGHSVVVCGSGEEAMIWLGREAFDLVFTDFRMPGMNGQEFYQAAVEEHPWLAGRVVFVTGDTASDSTQWFIRSVGGQQLTKPFQFAQVQRLISGFCPRP